MRLIQPPERAPELPPANDNAAQREQTQPRDLSRGRDRGGYER